MGCSLNCEECKAKEENSFAERDFAESTKFLTAVLKEGVRGGAVPGIQINQSTDTLHKEGSPLLCLKWIISPLLVAQSWCKIDICDNHTQKPKIKVTGQRMY